MTCMDERADPEFAFPCPNTPDFAMNSASAEMIHGYSMAQALPSDVGETAFRPGKTARGFPRNGRAGVPCMIGYKSLCFLKLSTYAYQFAIEARYYQL
jgi:hypothetical protein